MNKKILVCDDDDGILQITKIMLEGSGYIVKTLNTGKGIQKRIKEFKPDIIFLDIWMPGVDGEEVTKILKRDPQTKHIPIIVISALNNTQEISEKIQADDFLNKPFEMEELIKKAQKHSGQS